LVNLCIAAVVRLNQDHYNFATRPFNWRYTTKDLDDLLARLAAHDTDPLTVAA
jgi:hypothetical protein